MPSGLPIQIAPREILRRVVAGERTATIAESLGLSASGLMHWLRQNAEAEWREAQVFRAIERKEKCDALLERALAGDPIEQADVTNLVSDVTKMVTLGKISKTQIAGARELLKSAQWDLERLLRRIYGPQIEVQVQVSIAEAMTAALARRGADSARVVDAEYTTQSSPSASIGPDCQSVAALPPPHAPDIFGE